MKFNEKLIQLRKKEGLSQEELGYRLNVTRQTVSKWELGQTTPEMDKLIELSKIFNISVDELINEESEPITQATKIEDQPIGDINSNKKEKNMKFIIIVILVVIIISIVVKLAIALPIFNKVSKEVDNTSNKQQSFFERIFGGIEGIANKIEEKQENSQNNINEEMKTFTEKAKENIETESVLFNFNFNNCNGTQRGMILKTYLDNIEDYLDDCNYGNSDYNKTAVRIFQRALDFLDINVDELKEFKASSPVIILSKIFCHFSFDEDFSFSDFL